MFRNSVSCSIVISISCVKIRSLIRKHVFKVILCSGSPDRFMLFRKLCGFSSSTISELRYSQLSPGKLLTIWSVTLLTTSLNETITGRKHNYNGFTFSSTKPPEANLHILEIEVSWRNSGQNWIVFSWNSVYIQFPDLMSVR